MKKGTYKTKMAGGILALALVGITAPTTTQAATQADLQAQIQSLLAQITALQKQFPNTGTPIDNCTLAQVDITLGQSNTAVTKLQSFLIAQGFSIPAGATGYFGGQTQQALARFQATHSISPAVGYYGPVTRAKVASICSSNTSPVTTPTTPVPPTETPTTTPSVTLRGEGAIERFSVNDGNDTDLQEGEKNQEVMEVSFRVTDGDLKINRFDIGFTPDSANNEQDPWDTFSTISIWNGSSKIAETDASLKKNWKENSPASGDYMLRLANFNWVVTEDKEIELTVKATVQKSIKGTADGEIWNMFVSTNGIRGLDAHNTATYAGDTADAVTLNIDQAGATDEIIVRRSDADLDATTLQVKDNARSGYTKVFVFDIDTDDSTSDIEVRKLPVQLAFSESTLSTFVSEVRLVVDGKTYTRETLTDGALGTATFNFNSNELIIKAGDRVSATVEVDFKALPSTYEGTTITGSIDASNITANGTDRLTSAQLQGTVTGETHALYSTGQTVAGAAMTAVVTTTNGALNDYITFSGTMTITPFGQDVYIPTDGTGVSYMLTDALGNALTASGTAVVTSSAKESNNYFYIAEGQTKTVTVDVTYVPGVANTTARMQVLGINYSSLAQPATQVWAAQPAATYRTPTRTIVD